MSATRFALFGLATSLSAVLLGLIRAKVVASIVGPSGVGIVAEVAQAVSFAGILSNVASGPTLIRFLAEASRAGDRRRTEDVVATAITLGVILSVLSSIILIIISPHILPNDWPISIRLSVLLGSIGAMLTLMSSILSSVHMTDEDSSSLAACSLSGTVIGTTSIIALVIPFGIMGQFLSLAVGGVGTVVAVLATLSRKGYAPGRVLSPRWDAGFAREAFSLGATSLISGAMLQGVMTTIRWSLEHKGGHELGAAYNGNFQAANSIAVSYFGMVLGGLSNFYFPRFAKALDADELAVELDEAAKFVLKLTPALVFGGIAFRATVIRLLYSDRFEFSSDMLGYQLAGDIAKVVSWVYAGPLPMRGKIRAYLFTEMFAGIVGIPLYYILIEYMGPIGTGIGYALVHLLYAPVVALVTQRVCNVRITWRYLWTGLGLTAFAAAFNFASTRISWLRWSAIPIIIALLYLNGLLKLGVDKFAAKVSRFWPF